MGTKGLVAFASTNGLVAFARTKGLVAFARTNTLAPFTKDIDIFPAGLYNITISLFYLIYW